MDGKVFSNFGIVAECAIFDRAMEGSMQTVCRPTRQCECTGQQTVKRMKKAGKDGSNGRAKMYLYLR